MKQKLWLTMAGCIAYCIDKELYKAIDYLREQVRVLVEQQEKQNKRIILTNSRLIVHGWCTYWCTLWRREVGDQRQSFLLSGDN